MRATTVLPLLMALTEAQYQSYSDAEISNQKDFFFSNRCPQGPSSGRCILPLSQSPPDSGERSNRTARTRTARGWCECEQKTAPLFKRTLLGRFAWQGASWFSLRTSCPARACGCLSCQLQLPPIAASEPAPCEGNLPTTRFAAIDACFHWQSLVSALRSAASKGRAWCRHWTRSCSLGAVAPNPCWCQLASLSTTSFAKTPLFGTRIGPTKLPSVG